MILPSHLRVYVALLLYQSRHAGSPTLRELAGMAGLPAASARAALERLDAAGLVRYRGRQARGVELTSRFDPPDALPGAAGFVAVLTRTGGRTVESGPFREHGAADRAGMLAILRGGVRGYRVAERRRGAGA